MKKAFFKATSLVLAIILTVISLPTAAVVGAALEGSGETTVLLSGANTTPNVTAYDVSYTTYTENGVTKICITKYKGTKTELVFPNELNGMVIGEIGDGAFRYCSSLKSITIPAGVTSIGERAFYECRSLTSITIPAGVTSIGNYAFYYCSALESITVKNGNTVYHSDGKCLIETASKTLIAGCKNSIIPADGSVTSIGDWAFSGFSSLTSIIIPEGVTTIGDGAFYWCDSLTSITIPDGVTYIGNSAFYSCSSLTSIAIPDSVTSIGERAFEYCRSLTSIILPDGVTSIGMRAFSVCSSLTNITIPDSVTSIGNGAFDDCSSLTSVTISEGVTSIGDWAFSGCSSLTSITIPDGVTTIGNGAFEGCSSLTSITIPDSVTSIGDSAFSGCSSLTSVTIPEGVTEIGSYAFSGCSSLTSVIIPVSVTSIGDYAFSYCSSLEYNIYDNAKYLGNKTNPYMVLISATSTNITSCTINADTKIIADYAFSSCSSLTSIILPDGITSIRFNAFLRCSLLECNVYDNAKYLGNEANPYVVLISATSTNITSCTINDNTKIITEDAFSGCSSLTSITIPAGVTSIGEHAFYYCSSLTSITIPAGVTSIGSFAFSYCSSLTSITIPDGVTSIGRYAFYNCSSLISISIPDSITSIGDSAFFNCYKLTSIIIPEGVTKIGERAFEGCSSLTSITIPESVTSIGGGAFSYCNSLTSITIPESITSIGDSAFSYCSALTSINIPAGVTSIGDSAFSYCSALTSVTIPEGVTFIGSWAFLDCSSLTSITIPKGVTSIGYKAFSGCYSLTNFSIPGSVTSIDSSAFYNCLSLTSISIPDSITSIGDSAFYNCSSLTSISIPDSITSIGDSAFFNCYKLTSITIPEGVIEIGDSAFSYCSSLTSITIPESVTEIGNRAFSWCSALESITVENGNTMYHSAGKCLIETASKTLIAGCKNSIIPADGSVTKIGDSAFSGCRSLTSTCIPKGVTEIGDYAFYYCDSLTNITISDGIISIGEYAFFGCNKLYVLYNYSKLPFSIGSSKYGRVACYAKLIIDKNGNKTYKQETGIEYIDTPKKFLFSKTTDDKYTLIAYFGGEETVTLPDNINGKPYTIDEMCGVKNVIITSGFTEINSNAFSGCRSLTNITFSENITAINSYAFFACSSLTSVTILESVTSIGNYAFAGCDALESITVENGNTVYHSNGNCLIETASKTLIAGCKNSLIPADGSVTSIGRYAFSGCRSLTSTSIPKGVTEIGDYAFSGCDSLASIIIPYGVTSIGDGAFDGCSSLTSITIPESVTKIGNGAFLGCTALETVYGIYGSYAETFAKQNGYIFVPLFAIGSDITTLNVYIPYSGSINPYLGLKVRIIGKNDGKQYVFFVENSAYTTMYGIDSVQNYKAELISDNGTVFGTVEDFGFSEGTAKVTFDNLPKRQNAVLTVTANGEVLTSGYTVKWYFTDTGEYITTGNTVKDVVAGTKLTYEIVPDNSLKTRYTVPAKQSITISDTNAEQTYALVPLPEITVTGTVKNSEGTALPNVQISVSEKISDKVYRNLLAKTDSAGSFTLTLAGVQSKISVTANGYKDASWEGIPYNGEVIGLELTALAGALLTLNLNTAGAGEETQTALRSANNITFTVRNNSTGDTIEDFTVQYPSIILPTGTVSNGDSLTVTAEYSAGGYNGATATVTYSSEGANNVSLNFIEKGKFTVTASSSENQSNMLLLFDSAGGFVGNISFDGLSAQSDSLNAGSYTAVIIGKSVLLYSVSGLDELSNFGLVENSDYIKETVAVSDGEVTEISVTAIPLFDETKLYYTDQEKTAVTINRKEISLGQKVLLKVEFAFDDITAAEVSDTVIKVDLPAGCTIVQNGIALDGILTTEYTFENGVLTVPVGKKDGTLRMYVIPTARNEANPISASLDFKLSGNDITQPLGSTAFKSTDMEISLPSRTAQKQITVTGKTLPGAVVELFDNGVSVATVISNAAGSFSAKFELVNPESHSYHDIYAKVTTNDGTVLNSQVETLLFDAEYIEASKVTMITGNGATCVFDFLNPETPTGSYTYIPGASTYTFKAEFTENAPDKISNVYVITYNGTEQIYVPVIYDETTGLWIGTYSYSSFNTPIICSVKYDFHDGTKNQTTPKKLDRDPVIDPSGYVYEAVEDNRLEGVTTTVYFKTETYDELTGTTTENITLWNAEDYDQQNPLVTDSNGYYEWFVPDGWWQVKYEKEGYLTVYSEWLPVPPPQTEVNIGMTAIALPEVESVAAYEDGIVMRFSRYMDIASFNSETVSVTKDGVTVTGTITPTDAKTNSTTGDSYAKSFKFTAESALDGAYLVSIGSVKNYAGNLMSKAYRSEVSVESKPESIGVEESLSVTYGKTAELEIAITPAEAGVGKTVYVTVSSGAIISVSSAEIVTDAYGKAKITVEGLLPGESTVTFRIKDTDITASTTVTVQNIKPTVQTVAASIADGSVPYGTMLELTTDTEGAEIYYTTDLSCPCDLDSTSRKKYEGPIAITEDMKIIAYAIKDGYKDSETKLFTYTVIAASVTVSGTISAPKGMDGVTVLLYSSEISDADIRADMKKSNPEKALAFTASMGEVSSVGDTYTRQFTFNGVTAGSYKLAIHKAGAYTVEIKSVTTGQTNIDIGAMSIGIMGDADGNGEINSVDYSICKRIVLQSLKNATERNRLASDANGNGNVDTTDYAMIKRHVLGTYTIG